MAHRFSKKERERLGRLAERCEILRARIAANLNPDVHHHKMELSALQWAIEIVLDSRK